MRIPPMGPGYEAMGSIKKGVAGGVVAYIALAILSSAAGLTPEQRDAALVLTVAGVEALRNLLKKKLPKIFGWL